MNNTARQRGCPVVLEGDLHLPMAGSILRGRRVGPRCSLGGCVRGGRRSRGQRGRCIILAFLTHTVLEWMDDSYRLLRQKLPSRQRLFNDIRTLTTYLCFDSWAALTAFMLNSFEPPPPQPETG